VKQVFRPDNVNYSLLGNWVGHLHWHIYPRYASDPDFGQPMVMHWRVSGERVMPPGVELKEQPLTPDEKKRLKLALEAAFSH
jgi:diadenosine tetraphosphate (Ap4A) HIT family hydrolase